MPNVYTCMTNAGEYIPGRTTDYAACRVPYDHMFDLGALVEAGAAAGLRHVWQPLQGALMMLLTATLRLRRGSACARRLDYK